MDTEPTATKDEQPDTGPADPEPETPEQLPGQMSVEFVDRKEEVKAETGVYSKRVQGKLWLEGFAGPSRYDPDRFGWGAEVPGYDPFTGFGTQSVAVEVEGDAPKVKGPEFGGAIGGAVADPDPTMDIARGDFRLELHSHLSQRRRPSVRCVRRWVSARRNVRPHFALRGRQIDLPCCIRRH